VVCGGDGVVLSEASAAVDAERRLRALAASAPRTKAFKVELEAKVAATLIGPGASRLLAIEEDMKRRFLIVSRDDVPVDHFEVLAKGTLESVVGDDPNAKLEGKTFELKLGEVGRHDVHAAVGKHDGLTVSVGHASKLVGKKAKVRIERVLEGVAYASLVAGKKEPEAPITAEDAAEKPTRKPPAKKQEAKAEAKAKAEAAVAEPEQAEEPEAASDGAEAEPQDEQPKPKKKTRRGSRGGRRRKKKPATTKVNGGRPADEQPAPESDGEGPKIHLPDPLLGREEPEPEPEPQAEAPSGNGAEADGEQPKPKKKTRRGSRGGRNRKRRPASAKAESPPAE
jgi:predicted RNA-binding protein with TRAM domain